ncbi:hypothetical protein G6M26_06540 [Agrobacterium tumefaciens]|nr:hypothetical protein [Agrobacterium tumefaciens]NTE18175.1 hypothetical protein [Agrobacterium tumefaciens]
MLKKTRILFAILLSITSAQSLFAQTFNLPGDGNWYRVTSIGGAHGEFKYIYSHHTANRPAMLTGEIQFINSQSMLIQQQHSMGYADSNLPQFALINFGNVSEVWIKAFPGVATGEFTITSSRNIGTSVGDMQDADLADNGGILKIYPQIQPFSHSFYGNMLLPESSLSIGTNHVVDGFKLAVDGKIMAREVKVTTDGWADFVFDPGYKNLSLPKTEQFIKENHHLPGMKPASEVEKNGILVGDMNKKLLQKIEELTLHLIAMDKEIKLLKKNHKKKVQLRQ